MLLSSFLAATLLPLGSEVVLIALIHQQLNVGLLIAIATLGNVLGSCVNYWLGYWGANKFDSEHYLERFERWGTWSLLLAWVPVIGDPLTVVAGSMKVRFATFVALVTAGKLLRYLVIAYGYTLTLSPILSK